MKKPHVLIILDGFGYSKEKKHNAIAQANTPNLDAWFAHYPHALLQASGKSVGLPEGFIGNSEVGHLTIGAGRIIKQPVSFIHDAIKDKQFFNNETLLKSLQKIKKNKSALHIMGLLSDAGVHSHTNHLFAFLDAAKQNGITNIFVHPFLDGRDTPPQSAKKYLQQLDEKLKQLGCGNIGSIHGRFYAMDRDQNWDRTEKSHRVLTQRQKEIASSWQDVVQKNYAQNITDEFIAPTQLDPNATIKKDDGVIFINFRPDRARQLTKCFVDKNFDQFIRQFLDLSCFVTPVQYDVKLKTNVLYLPEQVRNTLKEILSKHNKQIFSIAETEKYAHVTYFFAGGKEQPFNNETRILIPSITTKTYVEYPCMSAKEITQRVLESLHQDPADFYVINYANADMVGHSGNMHATQKAIECLDAQLQKLYEMIVEKLDGTMYITADHGNAEQMFDEKNNQPRTAHTANPVPFIFINKEIRGSKEKLPLKQLADIAPFILKQMDVPTPPEMK